MAGFDQTLRPFLWRAEQLYPDKEVVSRTTDGISRETYSEFGERTRKLANVLESIGIEDGDRVGTFCWNTHRHAEVYFAAPNMGGQLHTINPLLPPKNIQYIVENAEDKLIFVGPSLVDDIEDAYDDLAFESVEHIIVMSDESPNIANVETSAYESLLDQEDSDYEWPMLNEEQPAGMCYTSGTTGRPKGVEYTQQMLWSHTMASMTPMGLNIDQDDVVMPIVPMFHVNAWGLPFTATAAGAKHVYPGPSPDPEDVVQLINEEGVTLSAGVPTVWIGVMEYVQENDVDLPSLERVVVGGSSAPKELIRQYNAIGVDVVHAWGMTEMSPLGSIARLKPEIEDKPYEEKLEKRSKQGLIIPGLEFQVIDSQGNKVPWNGEDFGELQVRGPWVTDKYFKRPDANKSDFDGSWFKTGDIVTVDKEGYIKVVDRTDDMIKSGGEWISSQELENTIMAHDDIVEATVVGVDHDEYQERPAAFIVPKKDDSIDTDELEQEIEKQISEEYPRWWAPDAIVEIEEIPKTATGKFDKKQVREEYASPDLLES